MLVVGAGGGVGSAALYHLARRGAAVVGIDRFPPGHDRGSSHGDTRVIRMAYFEHPDYVPLLRRAYELWRGLERERQATLYHAIGLVEIGPPDGDIVRGVLESAARHDIPIQRLEAREVETRFPGFRVPAGSVGVYEAGAGYLEVEACVRAHAESARAHGADLRIGESVRQWRAEGDGVEVVTDRARYSARRLVLAPGAWTGDLLGDVGIAWQTLGKGLFWYEADDPAYSAAGGCPVFLFDTSDGVFYGFPRLDGSGLKTAEHSGGWPVEDPLTMKREPDPSERARVERFLAECLPGVGRRLVKHAACLYPMSPDGHFVVDRHPEHPEVAFAAGLSGHGFKFVGVLGEALADLALEGATRLPIGFLSADRPGLGPVAHSPINWPRGQSNLQNHPRRRG